MLFRPRKINIPFYILPVPKKTFLPLAGFLVAKSLLFLLLPLTTLLALRYDFVMVGICTNLQTLFLGHQYRYQK
jgi:hypothetical protein